MQKGKVRRPAKTPRKKGKTPRTAKAHKVHIQPGYEYAFCHRNGNQPTLPEAKGHTFGKDAIRPDRYDDETMNVKTTVSDTKPNQHSKVIEIYKKSYGDNWEKMLRARMDKKGVDPAIYGL